ncbi:hypothetical protein [Bacillus thuringiensis]|uniref:hypothetical protein n=1 Tax=Bacillus thuringiensis TaxID=1428 RepID=UPI0037CBF046
MKFQDDLNHTSLMIEEQKQKGSINLSMKNLNMNERPISLSITRFKVKKMQKVIYNYLRKMNGANISVFSEYWNFPSKKAELQLSLNEENRWIEIKLVKKSEDIQQESLFYLNEQQSQFLLNGIQEDVVEEQREEVTEVVKNEIEEEVKEETKEEVEKMVKAVKTVKTVELEPLREVNAISKIEALHTDVIFEDFYKKTKIAVNKEEDRNRIEFKITGQTFDENPVSLCITYPKFSAIQEILVNYLQKMNKEDVDTHGQSWEFAGQHSIFLVNLERDKSLVRVEIEYDNVKKDRYNRGHIHLSKEDIEEIINKTSQILSA